MAQHILNITTLIESTGVLVVIPLSEAKVVESNAVAHYSIFYPINLCAL